MKRRTHRFPVGLRTDLSWSWAVSSCWTLRVDCGDVLGSNISESHPNYTARFPWLNLEPMLLCPCFERTHISSDLFFMQLKSHLWRVMASDFPKTQMQKANYTSMLWPILSGPACKEVNRMAAGIPTDVGMKLLIFKELFGEVLFAFSATLQMLHKHLYLFPYQLTS